MEFLGMMFGTIMPMNVKTGLLLAIADILDEHEEVSRRELIDQVVKEQDMDEEDGWKEVNTVIRRFTNSGAAQSFQRGSHWFIRSTPFLEEWIKEQMSSLMGNDDAEAKDLAPVMIHKDRPIPRAEWMRYYGEHRKGNMRVAFIPTSITTVAYKDPDTGKTIRMREHGTDQA